MTDKIIAIEEESGPFQEVLQSVLRLVPDRDKTDKNLLRLLAFRLKVDGETKTKRYLLNKIRDFVQQRKFDKLYDFLQEDMRQGGTGFKKGDTEPPEIA